MPKRSSKKKDVNETAFSIVQQATGQSDPTQDPPEKNPAAVSLGRLGGLKGGKARAEKLSGQQRRRIASKAAKARWAKEKSSELKRGGVETKASSFTNGVNVACIRLSKSGEIQSKTNDAGRRTFGLEQAQTLRMTTR